MRFLPGGGIIDVGRWSVIARIFSDLPCPERARDRAKRSWRRDSLGPLCARQWLPFVLLPVARLSMMAAPRTGLARHLRRKPLKKSVWVKRRDGRVVEGAPLLRA